MDYLNDTNDLEKELRASGAEYDDLDYNRKLTAANDRLISMVGRQYIEKKRIQYEDETTINLDFNSLESFDKVVLNGEIVDESNYTANNDDATVDFDQSYVDDNFDEGTELKFYHVPSIFKTIELYIAVRNVLETETIVTGDEVTNTQTDRLNQRIQAMVKRVNSKSTVSVQHGDNQNRGSAFPRRFGGGLNG